MAESRGILGVGDAIAGRYVLERRLGQGGMGAVFVARDERLGRQVALKTLLAAAGDASAQRLEAEARAVASLDHPGIVKLFDVVTHGSDLVLVMELLDGESLRDVVARGPLDLGEVARVVSAAADALFAAHERGLVHRDVKPENLLRRKDGRVALLDFGIAKVTAEAAASPLASSLTDGGAIVGTPAYLAPEQALGGLITPATDQFALAVLAFELLTGNVPWPSGNLAALVAGIVMGATPSACDARPELDPAVDAALARALSKPPDGRFPSIRDFADALASALGDAGVATRTTAPASSSSSPSKPVRASPRAVDPYSVTQDAPATPAAPQTAPRSRRALLAVAALAVVGASTALAVRYGSSPSRGGSPTSAPSASARLLLEEVAPSTTDAASAATSYRAAMHALSVGDPRRARDLLDGAIKDDPRFASALLQRAYLSLISKDALDPPGRAAFRAALDERGALDERDAQLLDALAPSFLDPPDWTETANRLEAFLAARQSDEQGWLARIVVDLKLGRRPMAFADANAALALNPKSGLALLLRAQLMVFAGDLEGANRALSSCVDLVPENLNCRIMLGAYAGSVGDCREADRAGRGLTSIAPDNPYGYELRAAASAGLGEPDVAIADLLAQRRAALPDAARPPEEAFDTYRLALRRGDFEGALGALDREDASLPRDDGAGRGRIAVSRARILCETGDVARCGATAIDYLERAASRPVPERLFMDPTPALLAFAHAAGALDDAAFRARRGAWAEGWRTRLGDVWSIEGDTAWLMAYVSVADPTTPAAMADAKEAIAARPRFSAETLPSLPALGNIDFGGGYFTSVGATFLAAGALDDARTNLEIATRVCAVIPDVRAHWLLALVHEAQGDGKRACEELGVVERWWGQAKPTSKTVEAARAHAKSCAPR